MSYGLYDGDIILYKKVPFFNLELMKFSSYYKKKHEIVNLSIDFKPNMYQNFIVRQDYPVINPYSLNYQNVVYGGRAFDGEKYQPLPIQIEECKPDRLLYNKIEPNISTFSSKTGFSTMRRAEHLRLSLDGITIWNNFEKQLHYTSNSYGIIFHDYDLNSIEGSYELVTQLIPDVISNKAGRRIGMKFPAHTHNEEELIKWLSIKPMGKYYSLEHDGLISLNNIDYFKEINKEFHTITKSTINITKNITYEDFIDKGIVELLQTILILRRNGLNFPLIYDKNFFMDSKWEEVTKYLVLFNNHIGLNINDKDYFERVAPYETFFDFMKKGVQWHVLHHSRFPKQRVMELFQFVRETNYELFKTFYSYTGG